MVDFLDELMSDDDDNEGEDKTEITTSEELKTLREEINELNKEKAGLLKGVKTERSKRQEINGKLTQLTETVNGILTNRESVAADVVNQAAGAAKAKGLPVTWTEDGEGFVGTEAIDEILNPYKNEILNLKQQLELTNQRTTASNDAESVRRAIVGEDERYTTAYNKYQAARKWAVDQVADFAQQNGVNKALSSGEALDHVFNDSDRLGEFSNLFPNINLVDIVTAEDSKHHFRTTMSNMANVLSPSEEETQRLKPDSRFQKVLNKPSSLGTNANAKAGTLSVMDKLASLTALDIMDIDDATAAKLEAAMAAEEKSDGVNF